MDRINIAIDGPAGAGKSTIAKGIAQKLGIIYLDTGAMYRAMALKALRMGLDPAKESDVQKIIDHTDIQIRYNRGAQRVILDEEDVSDVIRTAEVSKGASDIATIGAVREKLVELQRAIAKNNDVIMDGRDIGSNVLPLSNNKFYITASVEERAKRRYTELLNKNPGMSQTLEEIRADIEARDRTDSTRKVAPLKLLPDATYIDTTGMTIAEAIAAVMENLKP